MDDLVYVEESPENYVCQYKTSDLTEVKGYAGKKQPVEYFADRRIKHASCEEQILWHESPTKFEGICPGTMQVEPLKFLEFPASWLPILAINAAGVGTKNMLFFCIKQSSTASTAASSVQGQTNHYFLFFDGVSKMDPIQKPAVLPECSFDYLP